MFEELQWVQFQDRIQAGKALAKNLRAYAERADVLVLALPRGGVPVAFQVARALAAPLDVFVVRKLGVPGQRELAMGAVATGGVRVLNQSVVDLLDIPSSLIEAVALDEEEELRRRERVYRGDRPPLDVVSRTVLLVDDGIATGSTMRAALVALRKQNAERITVAVPVAPPDTVRELRREADEVVCLASPEPFWAVGYWYHAFTQTSDEEVRALLDLAARDLAERQSARSPAPP